MCVRGGGERGARLSLVDDDCHYFSLSHVFKGDNGLVCRFDKKTYVAFLADTVEGRSFKLCTIIYNLARGLAIHTRFDDLDFISRSHVCQNHKLQVVVKFLSSVV